MSVDKVTAAVTDFFTTVLEKTGCVINVAPDGEGWRAQIEVVEEADYMRRRGRDDLLALYDVTVNEKFEITSYRRAALRSRNETEYQAVEAAEA